MNNKILFCIIVRQLLLTEWIFFFFKTIELLKSYLLKIYRIPVSRALNSLPLFLTPRVVARRLYNNIKPQTAADNTIITRVRFDISDRSLLLLCFRTRTPRTIRDY